MTHTPVTSSERSRSRVLLIAAAVLFSTGGAAIKATTLTGWQVAGFRSGVAALAVLIMLPAARRGLSRWTLPALLVGCAYAATMILFVQANKLTTSANTIFLQSTAPIYLVLLGPWLLGEHNRARDFLVMAAMAFGLALFFVGTEQPIATAPHPIEGNLLALLAGFGWALTVMGMRWMGRADHGGTRSAAAAVVLGNALAFLFCFPWALPIGPTQPIDWLVIGYLGIFQIGIAYVCLTSALRHIPALEASLLLLVEPVLNPIWAWFIHGERPGTWALCGGAVILLVSGVKSRLE
jgi:drug/metabolite transporter (DMT)-like permease